MKHNGLRFHREYLVNLYKAFGDSPFSTADAKKLGITSNRNSIWFEVQGIFHKVTSGYKNTTYRLSYLTIQKIKAILDTPPQKSQEHMVS